jgi:hypothetical protein
MIIELAAYRQKKAARAVAAIVAERTALCANSDLACVIPVRAAIPVKPMASPELSDIDGDYAGFHTLAYGLATQI